MAPARSSLHARKQQPDHLREWANKLAQTHVHNKAAVARRQQARSHRLGGLEARAALRADRHGRLKFATTTERIVPPTQGCKTQSA